jgi:2-iminobutanoate/2-iminopropanoate deaminase
MNKTVIYSANAPEPIGPYSQAILAGNMLFVSGQIALQKSTGTLISSSIEEETDQVLVNIKEILQSAGFEFAHIVKCSIFLKSMNDFPKVNERYARYFSENPPARETVEVSALPKNVNVEISCIAVK